MEFLKLSLQGLDELAVQIGIILDDEQAHIAWCS